MSIYLILFITSLLTSAGQLCQKQAALVRNSANSDIKKPSNIKHNCIQFISLCWTLTAVIFLGFGFITWLYVLRYINVSIAYPLLSINYIFISLGARYIFNEQLNAINYIGLVMIMGGIAFLVN
ncbi:EamA family transporter [Thorsellia anophelis]|uniref:Undecaprenyl phosphate-alpha-L-ara4N flippase subunit ArnE n=1 Tax=Thorsellia anophelis DSM 18579 TaxID=1123402 RepID=A0A1I0BQ64_9GAMM|nr:EamA family transporter [Thorsellia anophelis]SET08458.1 undecaprenyl phosphate-alpha-L-ara4N flippase subunit ArnE [Thorsellia anophelis DSM 18579]